MPNRVSPFREMTTRVRLGAPSHVIPREPDWPGNLTLLRTSEPARGYRLTTRSLIPSLLPPRVMRDNHRPPRRVSGAGLMRDSSGRAICWPIERMFFSGYLSRKLATFFHSSRH